MTAETLQQVLRHYQAGEWRADRVLVTGDIIQDDSAGAYERFRELLLPLKLRVHCVPGNHDIPAIMQKICRVPPFSYCAYEEIGEWLLIGIDSCVTGVASGSISEAELDRLSSTIDDCDAKHIMVCLHHPPVPLGSAWLDTVGLKNGDAFLERLADSGRVRLAVFGHVHQDYDAVHNGVRIIATPSTCRQFKPRSDEFAVDHRPPAYRRFTLYPDGNVDAELVWVDAG